MGLDNGQSAGAVRLLGIGPEEVMLGVGVLVLCGSGLLFRRLGDGSRTV